MTGGAAGAVVLIATEVNGSAEAEIALTDTNPVRAAAMTKAASYVAVGASGSWTVSLAATQDGAAAAGVPVIWTAGMECALSSSSAVTDATRSGGGDGERGADECGIGDGDGMRVGERRARAGR